MQKEIKGKNRRSTRKKTINLSVLLVVLLAAIAILLLSYNILGAKLTIVVALLMFVFLGFCFLIASIKNKKRRKKIISILVILFLILGILCLSAFCAFMIYIKKVADPKYENAKLYTQEVTRMYAKDGTEFAKLGEEKREKVKYDQLPEVLIDAIISIEDSRFFSHNGFDAPRFLKASIGQLTIGEGAGGASTLTMQVVKNSFTSTEASGIAGITRKFEDIYLAVFKLEKDYSKEEIIEYYVNNHHLGGSIYGVQEASRKYFGKDVTDLNLSEAAIIAGMFKAPNGYQPINHPEAAAKRRKTVLYQMRNHGYITKEEEQIANDIPIEALTSNSTPATENEFQGYVDTVANELKDKYGVNPYTTPLLVYTNLDISRQRGINAVLNGETFNWKDDLVQSGVAVLDADTGKIWAIGNGRNINNRSNSQLDIYNFATDIKRQPGSTAKPVFDYGPGMEYNNWSTYQLFNDEPYTYSNGRSIKNWDGGHFGIITLRTALAHSRNIPALKAFQQVDNDKIRDFVANLGIQPEVCNDMKKYKYYPDIKKCVNIKDENDTHDPVKLHEAHSIGAFTGVSPLIMAGAYAAFANGGYYNEPYSVEKFTYRKTGETIEHQSNKKQVMSDSTAFMIADVLQDISLSGGTPKNVGAKTGTTNYDDKTMENYGMPWDAVRDSWVVGFSRRTVIGLWYGYDSLTKEQIQQGYILHNIPATIAKDYLFNAYVAAAMESDREEFVAPSSVVKVAVAPKSDPPKLAAPGTEGIYEYFKKGFEPTEYDTTNYKLDGPKNFRVKENGNKVTLSWSAVDPGILANPARGKWGYNIYKDGVLIDWTDKTSYTYSPTTDIYGEYKVKATYKNYTEAQSNESTFTLEKPEEPEPEPVQPTCPAEAPLNTKTNKCECTDKTKTFDSKTNKCI